MKFPMMIIKNKKQFDKDTRGFQIEKVLIISFIIVFGFMILVQTILAVPSTRALLVTDIEFEGSPLKTEEYLYREGEIELELLNSDSDINLKILNNGDEVAVFSEKTVALNVKEGDIIEIDGTDTYNECEIAVKSCSSEINKAIVGKKTNVSNEIISFIKIKME